MTGTSTRPADRQEREQFTMRREYLEPLQTLRGIEQKREYLQILFNFAFYQIPPPASATPRIKGLFSCFCKQELEADWQQWKQNQQATNQ